MRTKAKVLLAEDSARMRSILKDLLLRNGYEIAGEAENGEEAVRFFNELRPDVVIMDLIMPGMTGIEALKAIKMDDSKARVVMASSLGQQHLVIEALRAGAADFFIKPLQAEAVIEALHNALK